MILKRAGAYAQASDVTEEARKMDLADRYLNTVSTRFALLANRLEMADKTIALFTKDSDNPNNLFDMQCMWYELAYGKSCLRQKLYGKALKKFTAIDKHFIDIIEDQFDFHSYCLRKMTLRAYVRMLRLEDKIYGHDYFVHAAFGIVRSYIRIFDTPKQQSSEEQDESLSNMSESERKKLESKRKKAAMKAAAEEKAKEEEAKAKKPKEDPKKRQTKVVEDADPHGKALAEVEDPLKGCDKYLKLLQHHASHQLLTHTLSAMVALRKKKYLLGLQVRCLTPRPCHVCSVHQCCRSLDRQHARDNRM